jgi:hypothetical protein
LWVVLKHIIIIETARVLYFARFVDLFLNETTEVKLSNLFICTLQKIFISLLEQIIINSKIWLRENLLFFRHLAKWLNLTSLQLNSKLIHVIGEWLKCYVNVVFPNIMKIGWKWFKSLFFLVDNNGNIQNSTITSYIVILYFQLKYCNYCFYTLWINMIISISYCIHLHITFPLY